MKNALLFKRLAVWALIVAGLVYLVPDELPAIIGGMALPLAMILLIWRFSRRA